MYRDIPASPPNPASSTGRSRCAPASAIFPSVAERLVVQRRDPGDREPAQLHPEEDHHQQGEPEGGDGEPGEDGHRGDPVEEGPLAHRRVDAHGNGHQEDEPHRQDVDRQRDRDPFLDLLRHRPPVRGEAVAEIERRHPAEPPPVLDVERLVEAVIRLEPRPRLGRRLRVEVGPRADRPPGGHVHHEERDEADPDEEGDGQQEPARDIPEHRVPIGITAGPGASGAPPGRTT